MSIAVRVSIRCSAPSCLHAISLNGGPGVNATTIRDIAENEYGWQVTKNKERCFEHRTQPIKFHPYRQTKNQYGWGTCGDCLGAAAHDSDSRRAVHREATIRKNHAQLAGALFVDWTSSK